MREKALGQSGCRRQGIGGSTPLNKKKLPAASRGHFVAVRLSPARPRMYSCETRLAVTSIDESHPGGRGFGSECFPSVVTRVAVDTSVLWVVFYAGERVHE